MIDQESSRLHEVVKEMLYLEQPEIITDISLFVGKYGEIPF